MSPVTINWTKPEDMHPISECDKLLRADPSFSQFRCTPDVWLCPVCRRVWEHVCDEAEGCHYVHHEGAIYDGDVVAARSATVIVDGKRVPARDVEITYDEADQHPWYSPIPNGNCSMCGDTGLMLGGWMGPTKQAPWPRACTSCDCGRAMTPRAVQLKVMELVQHDFESNYFTENDNGEPTRVPGYWAAKYVPLLGLDDPRFP